MERSTSSFPTLSGKTSPSAYSNNSVFSTATSSGSGSFYSAKSTSSSSYNTLNDNTSSSGRAFGAPQTSTSPGGYSSTNTYSYSNNNSTYNQSTMLSPSSSAGPTPKLNPTPVYGSSSAGISNNTKSSIGGTTPLSSSTPPSTVASPSSSASLIAPRTAGSSTTTGTTGTGQRSPGGVVSPEKSPPRNISRNNTRENDGGFGTSPKLVTAAVTKTTTPPSSPSAGGPNEKNGEPAVGGGSSIRGEEKRLTRDHERRALHEKALRQGGRSPPSAKPFVAGGAMNNTHQQQQQHQQQNGSSSHSSSTTSGGKSSWTTTSTRKTPTRTSTPPPQPQRKPPVPVQNRNSSSNSPSPKRRGEPLSFAVGSPHGASARSSDGRALPPPQESPRRRPATGNSPRAAASANDTSKVAPSSSFSSSRVSTTGTKSTLSDSTTQQQQQENEFSHPTKADAADGVEVEEEEITPKKIHSRVDCHNEAAIPQREYYRSATQQGQREDPQLYWKTGRPAQANPWRPPNGLVLLPRGASSSPRPLVAQAKNSKVANVGSSSSGGGGGGLTPTKEELEQKLLQTQKDHQRYKILSSEYRNSAAEIVKRREGESELAAKQDEERKASLIARRVEAKELAALESRAEVKRMQQLQEHKKRRDLQQRRTEEETEQQQDQQEQQNSSTIAFGISDEEIQKAGKEEGRIHSDTLASSSAMFAQHRSISEFEQSGTVRSMSTGSGAAMNTGDKSQDGSSTTGFHEQSHIQDDDEDVTVTSEDIGNTPPPPPQARSSILRSEFMAHQPVSEPNSRTTAVPSSLPAEDTTASEVVTPPPQPRFESALPSPTPAKKTMEENFPANPSSGAILATTTAPTAQPTTRSVKSKGGSNHPHPVPKFNELSMSSKKFRVQMEAKKLQEELDALEAEEAMERQDSVAEKAEEALNRSSPPRRGRSLPLRRRKSSGRTDDSSVVHQELAMTGSPSSSRDDEDPQQQQQQQGITPVHDPISKPSSSTNEITTTPPPPHSSLVVFHEAANELFDTADTDRDGFTNLREVTTILRGDQSPLQPKPSIRHVREAYGKAQKQQASNSVVRGGGSPAGGVGASSGMRNEEINREAFQSLLEKLLEEQPQRQRDNFSHVQQWKQRKTIEERENGRRTSTPAGRMVVSGGRDWGKKDEPQVSAEKRDALTNAIQQRQRELQQKTRTSPITPPPSSPRVTQSRGRSHGERNSNGASNNNKRTGENSDDQYPNFQTPTWSTKLKSTSALPSADRRTSPQRPLDDISSIQKFNTLGKSEEGKQQKTAATTTTTGPLSHYEVLKNLRNYQEEKQRKSGSGGRLSGGESMEIPFQTTHDTHGRRLLESPPRSSRYQDPLLSHPPPPTASLLSNVGRTTPLRGDAGGGLSKLELLARANSQSPAGTFSSAHHHHHLIDSSSSSTNRKPKAVVHFSPGGLASYNCELYRGLKPFFGQHQDLKRLLSVFVKTDRAMDGYCSVHHFIEVFHSQMMMPSTRAHASDDPKTGALPPPSLRTRDVLSLVSRNEEDERTTGVDRLKIPYADAVTELYERVTTV